MAFTVTATPGGASFQRGVDIDVRVYTNATESGGATSGGRNTAAGTAGGSLTPNFSSSAVVWVITSDTSSTWPAAATNNAYDASASHNHTDGWESNAGRYTGTVTAATPLTYGASGTATSADHENWCAYEIPASGGTITLDGSSPTPVTNDTGTSAVTASFTPPVGSVIVIMVAAGGSGSGAGVTCAISDTSGLGMTWTQRVTSSTVDNFQPTFIFTATVPAAPVPVPRPATAQTSRTWQRRWTRTVRPAIPPQVQQISVHAGVATAAASAMAPPGFGPFIYQLGGSGYNAWFADQQGNPRMMLSEQAWALPWNAGRWNSGDWQSDYTAYFAARSAQGYNAWYGVVWGNSHVDSAALSGGRSYDGVYPLTINGTPGAIATGSETVALNSTFWARIDAFIATAMKYGTAVFMNLSMSYDISDTGGIWQNATNTQGTAFGNALASRYPVANWPNLHWFFGDDDDGPNDSFYAAILTGIHNAGDTRSLISIEQFTNTNCHISFSAGGAFSGSFGAPNATYNFTYSYDAPYFGTEAGYTEGGSFTHIPPTYGDGVYYGDTGSGTVPDRVMRTFAWWALASGSRGFTATSGPSDLGGGGLWTWQSGAVARLTSDPNGGGAWCTTVAGAVKAYLTGLTDWHKLIPDTGNVFITAGRGTRGTCDAAGGVFNFRNTSTYVAGAVTPTGTLAVIYCKAAMSITIDQSKLNAGYTATWVDPASLATQSTSTGTTYASSGLGNNSAGDPDWVLVLQAPPAITAGAAAAGAVANAPAVAVTVSAGVAAAAGAAPAPRAAITVNAAVASSTAVANPPTVSTSSATNAPAGVATASAVALAAQASESVSAAVAASSAVALQPAASVAPGAAVAASGAVSLAPKAAAGISAGPAAGTGTALAPVPAAGVISAVAPASAIALPATVNTSGSTSAVAGVATAAAAAPGPQAAITAPAAASAGSAAAPAPVAAAAVLPAAATGHATALAASVTTGNITNAAAGVAASSALALAPATAVTLTAAAAAAHAVALAAAVPPPFTVGTLTAAAASSATLTAGTQRTGGPS